MQQQVFWESSRKADFGSVSSAGNPDSRQQELEQAWSYCLMAKASDPRKQQKAPRLLIC